MILQDSAGNRYVYGLDLLTRINGATEEWYLTDGLGSTTALADANGAVTGTYAYDVFGAVRSQTGATTEWNYTGEQHDASGLEYLRARYYDAATGRFASRDPLPLLQRYAYVGNDPVNYVDPTGLCHDQRRYAHAGPFAVATPTPASPKATEGKESAKGSGFDACSPPPSPMGAFIPVVPMLDAAIGQIARGREWFEENLIECVTAAARETSYYLYEAIENILFPLPAWEDIGDLPERYELRRRTEEACNVRR